MATPTTAKTGMTPFGGISSFGKHAEMALSWTNMSYKIDGIDRPILNNLSGCALPKRTLAIMGSSGAGKTTLLNAVSDRLNNDAAHVLSGERFFNTVPYDAQYRKLVAFVTQDDILSPMATPTEAFYFSARVRRGAEPAVAETKVNSMLQELGLEGAKDTIVGIPGIVAGLSGGERKRTNIGVELITDPKVLLLDEPTSGLDSVTAAKICKLLHQLAENGRTVAFTIHQPTSDCYQHFDDIMLMCRGQIVFHGPTADAIGYFAERGYECPETHTPTDFFMTLLQDVEVSEILIDLWHKRVAELAGLGYPYLTKPAEGNDDLTMAFIEEYMEHTGSTLGTQFGMLMQRSWRASTRNIMFIASQFVQAIFFGLIASLIFVDLQDSVEGVADRNGLLFMIVANGAFSGLMGVLNTFPPEKAVYIREQQSNAYSPALYLLTKTLAEWPVQIAASLCQSVIIYWITGLVATAESFFIFAAATLMLVQVGVSLGMAISCAIDSYVIASGIAPLIVIPMMLAGGLLASTDRLRPYWYWLEKISFLRHSFLIMAKNEFENLGAISCNLNKYGANFCARQPKDGPAVLKALEFDGDQDQVWILWLSLAIIFVFGRTVCLAALYSIAGRKA
jgi:ABC-type multidrug transport system ATPase subunit